MSKRGVFAGLRPLNSDSAVRSDSESGLADDARGVVMVEYLIAVMPLFTMFMCMVQLALMMEAAIIVHHAANRAARSAIVVIREPKTFVHEDGEDPPSTNNYPSDASSLSDNRRPVKEMMKGLEHSGGFGGLTSGGAAGYDNNASGEARLYTIRQAAIAKTLSVSPIMEHLHGTNSGSSIKFALGEARTNGGGLDAAGSAANYAASATGVTVSGIDTWGGGKRNITVHVRYLFPCMVPIAQTLLCHSNPNVENTEGVEDIAGAQEHTTIISAKLTDVMVAPQIYMPGEIH